MTWLYQIPSCIGKAYARLTKQQLEGRKVFIKVEDSSDEKIIGAQLIGRIHSLPIHASTRGPNGTTEHGPGTLIIELKAEVKSKNVNSRWMLATPRLVGHDAYRLFIASIVVSLAEIDSPSSSPVASYNNVVAIAVVDLAGESK